MVRMVSVALVTVTAVALSPSPGASSWAFEASAGPVLSESSDADAPLSGGVVVQARWLRETADVLWGGPVVRYRNEYYGPSWNPFSPGDGEPIEAERSTYAGHERTHIVELGLGVSSFHEGPSLSSFADLDLGAAFFRGSTDVDGVFAGARFGLAHPLGAGFHVLLSGGMRTYFGATHTAAELLLGVSYGRLGSAESAPAPN